MESLIILFQPNDEEESVKSSNSRSKLGSRLSVRNGRSVVHKNLEDNYGAVISANHEALAQILEQVKTCPKGFGLKLANLGLKTSLKK